MSALLLHICCGPCAIMPALRLREAGYEPVLWFHNPNIQPLGEYLRRREAAEECAARLGLEALFDDDWNIREWLKRQLPLADDSARCKPCVEWRIAGAARQALQLGIKYFSTSLLYSKYQPHEHMAAYGKNIAESYGVSFVYRDFRTDWQEGIDRSREWNLYRQPYCGCVFSEAERYAGKLEKARKRRQNS